MDGSVNPRSPLDLKPDPEALMNLSQQSLQQFGLAGGNMMAPPSPELLAGGSMQNYGSPGSSRSGSPPMGSSYPPNHPLSGSKHFCSICGDRASGKHYGVYSCEGCKGFFKRTVRKELTYACRENRNCIIDKRQRNRCQFCRYMKCLEMGMKREAVQEERNRSSGGGGGGNNSQKDTSGEMEPSGTGIQSEMPLERILGAENAVDNLFEGRVRHHSGANNDVEETTREKMLHQVIDWAKHIPHFTDLRKEDQIKLIRFSWNELMIAGYAYRSLNLSESGILLGDGLVISREGAHVAGVGEIYDRVHVELIGKMKEMRMEKSELGCLRAIVLYNPDARGLDPNVSSQVESYREMVYATLEEHCRLTHEKEPSRFAKLLLRLPALRSIGLKCAEHRFFFRLIKEDRPFFNVSDVRDLDAETGDYNETNPLDNFMHGILEDS